ncbi:hypothetical protein BH11BAC2_BH11BAC2_08820 [soil metagenome]
MSLAASSSIQLLGVYPPLQLLLFIFSGTFLAYRFAAWKIYLQVKPLRIGFQERPGIVAFLIPFILTIIPLLSLHSRAIFWALGIALFSSLYFLQWGQKGALKNGLRSVPLLKNVLLAGAWSVTTVWFPCYEQGWSSGTWYLFITRFIFILAICFGVDLRDLDTDRSQQLKTLPVLFGYRAIKIICLILFALFIALVFLKPADVLIPFRNPEQKTALVVSCVITSIALILLKRNDSTLKYTLLLDGSMLLQALMIIAVA